MLFESYNCVAICNSSNRKLIQTPWHNVSVFFCASIVSYIHPLALSSVYHIICLDLSSHMFFPQPLNSDRCLFHGCFSRASLIAFKWIQCPNNLSQEHEKHSAQVICLKGLCQYPSIPCCKPVFIDLWLIDSWLNTPIPLNVSLDLLKWGDTGLWLWPGHSLALPSPSHSPKILISRDSFLHSSSHPYFSISWM